MCRQSLSATAHPHLGQLVLQLLQAEGVGEAAAAAAVPDASSSSSSAPPLPPGCAPLASALREQWATVVVGLAEGAAASLSPALCGAGGMMDPRHYIKVGGGGGSEVGGAKLGEGGGGRGRVA